MLNTLHEYLQNGYRVFKQTRKDITVVMPYPVNTSMKINAYHKAINTKSKHV